jgi:hypothetical protein
MKALFGFPFMQRLRPAAFVMSLLLLIVAAGCASGPIGRLMPHCEDLLIRPSTF